ncbi:uncharacterized protein LOC143145376 [Ptiloglossa arizonensis]|uniref:uncharacterized protein LOC143145376 n=1 Tax=Ptiloglossa arizonensis TaxID=3350558 RepID=UPI003FA0B029
MLYIVSCRPSVKILFDSSDIEGKLYWETKSNFSHQYTSIALNTILTYSYYVRAQKPRNPPHRLAPECPRTNVRNGIQYRHKDIKKKQLRPTKPNIKEEIDDPDCLWYKRK